MLSDVRLQRIHAISVDAELRHVRPEVLALTEHVPSVLHGANYHSKNEGRPVIQLIVVEGVAHDLVELDYNVVLGNVFAAVTILNRVQGREIVSDLSPGKEDVRVVDHLNHAEFLLYHRQMRKTGHLFGVLFSAADTVGKP